MDVKKLSLQDLESLFNMTSKVRDGVIMMARANNDINTPKFKNINEKYNMLLNEIKRRIDSLYDGGENGKEVLNEIVSH